MRLPTTRTGWLGLILVIAGVVVGLVAYGSQLKGWYWRWATVELAYDETRSQTGRLRAETPIALSNWIDATFFSDADLPTVALDIKFRHLMKLRAQREQALAVKLLVQGDDDYVPATMRLDNRAIRVKLRLKGDMTDQFDYGRWAFRIHVKQGDHLLGMRRFSLHHPEVRGFHTEPLFLEDVRSAGILAPRYRFVKVLLNGEDLGIMAVEEHFSKELLESQGRRESVIMKFVESRYWESGSEAATRHASPFTLFASADVVPFRASTVLESPILSSDLEMATSLYRGVLNGSLEPSEAFDAELWGRYLAIVDSWKATHATGYINLRLYYNPITAKLEPIAYDAELRSISGFVGRAGTLPAMLMTDRAIRAEYLASLKAIRDRSADDATLKSLAAFQDHVLSILHRQFSFLGEVDLGSLALNADSALDVEWGPSPATRPDSSVLGDEWTWPPSTSLSVYRIQDPDGPALQLRNLVPYEMAVRLAATDTAGRTFHHDLTLPPTPFRTLPEVRSVDLAGAVSFDSALVYRPGGRDSAWVEPLDYYRAATSTPIPRGSLESLARNPFLRFDPGKRVVSARAGSWDVTGGVSLPEGVDLVLEPGTELRFEPDAYLIVRGDTRFTGTSEDGVRMRPQDPSLGWKGLAVLNRGYEADWSNVAIEGTTGVDLADWHLTGGVTLYEGSVSIRNTEFETNRAEDALNLFRTSFVLEDVSFENTISDAVDIDFGSGSVAGGTYTDIGWGGGGDALDFSGARVTVSGVTFTDVTDKAISAGEASTVRVSGLDITTAGAGIASKDGSYVEATRIRIRNASHAALMAYTKKPVYGGAVLVVRDLAAEEVGREAQAQVGSLLRIDGAPVSVEALDVDSLYNTVMRKAALR